MPCFNLNPVQLLVMTKRLHATVHYDRMMPSTVPNFEVMTTK